MPENLSPLTSHLSHWQSRALLIGAVAAVASLIGFFLNRGQFFHSYLFAWLFWSGLSFGALVIVMMQFLTGGQWGLAVRRLSTAAFMTLPLMALLFLPILFGLHDIYGWSNGARAEAPGYHHKAQYLNAPFFTVRAVIYFVVLMAFALSLRKRMADHRRLSAAPALSAGGLTVYVLCMNFASTDWVMSLDPAWYSTVFVEVFASSQFLAALALMTALLCAFTNHQSLITSRASVESATVPVKALHDLGNMLLAFVIFWAYVAFAQFLIIWSGNLPKEISWYLPRSGGGWQWFALVLMLAQFLLPFALLLSHHAKRQPLPLATICILIVLANVLMNFWFVAPAFHPNRIYVHWLDFTEFVALGGFWFALFFYFLKQRPLLPIELMEEHQNG